MVLSRKVMVSQALHNKNFFPEGTEKESVLSYFKTLLYNLNFLIPYKRKTSKINQLPFFEKLFETLVQLKHKLPSFNLDTYFCHKYHTFTCLTNTQFSFHFAKCYDKKRSISECGFILDSFYEQCMKIRSKQEVISLNISHLGNYLSIRSPKSENYDVTQLFGIIR